MAKFPESEAVIFDVNMSKCKTRNPKRQKM